MAQRVKGDLYHELDGQFLEIKRQLRQSSGYPFNPFVLRNHLQRIIEGRFIVIRAQVPITVDYKLSLQEMLKEMIENEKKLIYHNIYTNVDRNITAEHFPIGGIGNKCNMVFGLACIDRAMKSGEVRHGIEEEGMQPAKIEELLAFGAQYPHVPSSPIVALGSDWLDPRGIPEFPVLQSDRPDLPPLLEHRELRLIDCATNMKWPEYYRFAAVKRYPGPF